MSRKVSHSSLLVGCFFDRRKNTAQVFVNGALSEEVSLRKIGLKFDVEAANPCVCLAQQGDVVRIEFARFVPDVAAVTKLAQLLGELGGCFGPSPGLL